MRTTAVLATLLFLGASVSGCASHYRDGRTRPKTVPKHPLAQKLAWSGVDATVETNADGVEEVVTTTGGAIVAGQLANVHYDWVILTKNGVSGDRMAVDETECHIDVIVTGTKKTIRCHPSDSCGEAKCTMDSEVIPNHGTKLFCACK